MPLIDLLVLGVGTGIAKGILKLWLKEYPIAEQAWGSLADVIKSLAGDWLTERAATRQFDQIAEKVSKNILEVLETEGNDLSAERREYVVEVAGIAIQRDPLTPELVLNQNLDPENLTDWFLDSFNRNHEDDPKQAMSPVERAVYVRILSEASQYIIDIASQMPLFTERTFAEVLRREDQLLTIVNQILDDVKRLQVKSGDEPAQDYRFEVDYRRAIARHYDELQLFGLDVTSSTSKKYRLSVAYISLHVERTTDRDEADTNGDAKDKAEVCEVGSTAIPSSQDDETPSIEVVPVELLLAETDRILVRGEAGSGKTTLLQWVAVTAAARNFKDNLEAWNDRIPFFIRLREYADAALPGPDKFVAMLSPVLATSEPSGWAVRILAGARAIVLIDGLDEVGENQRDAIYGWIQDLIDQYPYTQIIVTSRPYAASDEWLSPQGFKESHLEEMDSSQVRAFVEHWHSAVADSLQSAADKSELNELQSSLLDKLRANRAVHRLTTSPLLCAMICALHRDRVRQLPSDRIELYKACVDMFFRRDRERNIRLDNHPELSDRQKLVILTDLAYWLIRNGWTQVSADQAVNYLNRSLATVESLPPGTTGRKVLTFFIQRVGILRQPSLGQIDFPHRTFQEYLAAIAAVDGGNLV